MTEPTATVKTMFAGGVNPFLSSPDEETAVLPRRLIAATPAKIKEVLKSGPATCEQIAEAIGATHKNTSNRLRYMVIAGQLLQTCRGSKAKKTFYSINPNPDQPQTYVPRASRKAKILTLLAASETPIGITEIAKSIKGCKFYTGRMLALLSMDGLVDKTTPKGRNVKWFFKQ